MPLAHHDVERVLFVIFCLGCAVFFEPIELADNGFCEVGPEEIDTIGVSWMLGVVDFNL